MGLKLIISQDCQATENDIRDGSLIRNHQLPPDLHWSPCQRKMMRAPKIKIILLLISGILLASQAFFKIVEIVPQTGSTFRFLPIKEELSIIDPDSYNSAKKASQSGKIKQPSTEMVDFVNSIVDGESGRIRGIYSENEFAFPVVQQPSGSPGYVSTKDGVVTEFAMAKRYGVTGIIAHNYLAGRNFFDLEIGDVIQVVYGDGEVTIYEISSVQSYQALSPHSSNSQFIDLATSEKINASQLFKRVYMGSQHLTLQTCIQLGSEDSWGRLFIIAEPI